MNSVELYNQISHKSAEIITKRYSSSFSLGIKLLAKRIQNPIYSIYGYVRLADEIVDTFHDQDKKLLLEEFRLETLKSLDRKFSVNPIIHAFQRVVDTYNIPHQLIFDFLTSMRMDLEGKAYDEELYKSYIYGSAEVVGLMCLHVFSDGENDKFEELEPYARSLGAAFQKVNFLRDFKDDYEKRGRVYFPGVDFEHFSEEGKKQIEQDIEKDFHNALIGIKKLPRDSRLGVFLAYQYYRKLTQKIVDESAVSLQNKRIRISNSRKIFILVKSYIRHNLNWY